MNHNRLISLAGGLSLLSCVTTSLSAAADKPNFLWLWIEDTSYYNLGITGNNQVETPQLDSLAQNGVLFTRAYSCGPQSSPARSTLITGMYSFSTASDWHRQKRAVPSSFYFPQYLKQAGYYCTNNSKTDYNSTVANGVIWNASSSSAHYKNRSTAETPFFAVFNHGGTHMSCITDNPISKRTNRKILPSLTPLPAYLPDGDSLRDDRAWHLDKVSEMDNWVAGHLKALRDAGLDQNTIVFFSSDHGGCTPGSKGFLREDGVRVPLIIYFPPKWAHLKPEVEDGYKSNRIVGFVDLGPTLLSLAGIAPKNHFHGKPFLGEYAAQPRESIINFRCNQGNSYIPSRSIINHKYKLIWNYNTLWRKGMRNGFQWGMEGFVEWERMFFDNELSGVPKSFWEQEEPFELYDLEADPQEMNNLAENPDYKDVLDSLKSQLSSELRGIKDLGLYPKSLRRQGQSEPFYDYVRRTNQDVTRVIETAEIASTATENEIEELTLRLNDVDAAVRYWAALGIAQVNRRNNIAANFPYQKLVAMLNSTSEAVEVKSMVASALIIRGYNCEAIPFMLDEMRKGTQSVTSAMEGLDTYLRPATARIIAACEAIKANDPAYSKASLNDYNACLVNARILPYRLFKQSNMQLWRPFTNPHSVDTIPLDCNASSVKNVKDDGMFKLTRGSSRNQFILCTGNKELKSVRLLNIIGQQLNNSITQLGDEIRITIPEDIKMGYFIISFQHNDQYFSKTITI